MIVAMIWLVLLCGGVASAVLSAIAIVIIEVAGWWRAGRRARLDFPHARTR